VDQSFWKESKWENANKEDIELYNIFEEGVYTKKKEILFLVQRSERRSKRIYSRADKKGIYLTVKVTADCTSILHRKRIVRRE